MDLHHEVAADVQFCEYLQFLDSRARKRKQKLKVGAVNSAKIKIENHTQATTESGVTPYLLQSDKFAPFSIKYLAILNAPIFKQLLMSLQQSETKETNATI